MWRLLFLCSLSLFASSVEVKSSQRETCRIPLAYKVSSGMVNIPAHFSGLMPRQVNMINLVTAHSGILGSREEFANEMCQSIIKKITEGTLFIGLHNPLPQSFGVSCKALKDALTKTHGFFSAMSDNLRRGHSQSLWYHVMQSKGNLVDSVAISQCTKNQQTFFREHLIVLDLGSGDLQRKNWVKDFRCRHSCMRGFFSSVFPRIQQRNDEAFLQDDIRKNREQYGYFSGA